MQMCKKSSTNLEEMTPLLMLQEDFLKCSTNNESFTGFEDLGIFEKIHDKIEGKINCIETTDSEIPVSLVE